MKITLLYFLTACIFIILFILIMFLIFYKFKNKKERISLGFVAFSILLILYLSSYLALNSRFKTYELKNLNLVRSYKTEQLKVSANIINTGQLPINTCDITITLIDLAPKKVSGKIFGFDKVRNIFSDKKNEKDEYHSVKYTKTFEVFLEPKKYKKIVFNIPFPTAFADYKTNTRINCD